MFIELATSDGDDILININHIIEVHPVNYHKNAKTVIVTSGFSDASYYPIYVCADYNTVRKLITIEEMKNKKET